jgi:signal transduction histidine kinase
VEPSLDEPVASRGRGGLRALSVATLVILLAVTGLGAWATRSVVHDQEHRLVKERTSEVALILTTAIGSLQSNLIAAGTAGRLAGDSSDAFAQAAAPQLANPGTRALALLSPAPGGFKVDLAAGTALHAGDLVSGPRATTMQQALTSGKLLSSPVLKFGSTRALGLATGPPAAPVGKVLYLETAIAPPGPSQTTASAPFSELEVALYASRRADLNQLVVGTTTKVPLHGDVINQTFDLGASKWLLSVTAKQPLVGSVASRTPWLVLAAGILGSVLLSYLMEVVVRRRDYALTLVDERTAALRTSLTALESAQEQLVLQERLAAVGQLASAVGHELRNPLGVISNSLYLIRGATAGSADERLLRHIGTAEREVAASTLIISDLLDFARAREPIVASVDLAALIDEALEVAPPPAGVEVARDGNGPLPPVAADRDQLRQVLLNLISNGYDAMPEGGTLRVGANANGRRVSVKVADTGTGMDDVTRARVFEPFFTTKARGVGLGLAVTHRIVGALGGTIAVASSPGQGATFTVDLPVYEHAAEAPSR